MKNLICISLLLLFHYSVFSQNQGNDTTVSYDTTAIRHFGKKCTEYQIVIYDKEVVECWKIVVDYQFRGPLQNWLYLYPSTTRSRKIKSSSRIKKIIEKIGTHGWIRIK